MSDSGSTQPPSRFSNRAEQSSAKDKYRTGKIEALDKGLQRVDRQTRLSGQVVESRRGKDNAQHLKIRTERGDIDVKVPEREARNLPQKGEKIDVELPRGEPPRQVNLRPQTEQAAARQAASPQAPEKPAAEQPAVDIRQSPKAENDPDVDIIAVDKAKQNAANSTQEQRSTQDTLAKLATQGLSGDAKPAAITEGQFIRLVAFDPLTEQLNITSQIISQKIETSLTDALLPKTAVATTQTPSVEKTALLPSTNAAALVKPALSSTSFLQTSTTQTITGLNTQPPPAVSLTQVTAPAVPATVATADTPQPLGTQSLNAAAPTVSSQAVTANNLALPVTPSAAAASPFQNNIVANVQTLHIQTEQQAQQTQFDTQIATIKQEPLPSTDSVVQKPTAQTGALTGSAPAAQTVGAQKNTISTVQNIAHNTTGTSALITKNINAGQSVGRVAGFTNQNLPVLEILTQAGNTGNMFALQFQTNNLLAGSEVTLSAAQSTSGAVTTATTGPLLSFNTMLQHFQWPALQDLTNLINSDPTYSAAQSMQNVMNAVPSPASPARFTAAAMLFVAAMRGGDVSGWINDKAVDLLRSTGKGDLLNRLNGDFGSLSRMASDGSSTEWRMQPLPMNWQGDINPVMMYYKKDEHSDDNEQGKSPSGTRFIFDLSLSQMGPVQLDGYYKERPGQTKAVLDLIIRTIEPLSKAMQYKMKETYISALDYADVNGELGFQAKKENFITIETKTENNDKVFI
jgi:hypothetical protein